MNQPNPQRPQRPGQRRPGGPRPQGPQGPDGEMMERAPVKKAMNPWPLAILLTVLLVGASVFVYLKGQDEQAKNDAEAQLPGAFSHVVGGDTTHKLVVETGLLEGFSDEDLSLIKEAYKTPDPFAKLGRIPTKLFEMDVKDTRIKSLEKGGKIRDAYIADHFGVLADLEEANVKMDNEDYRNMSEKALLDFILRFYALDNEARIAIKALEAELEDFDEKKAAGLIVGEVVLGELRKVQDKTGVLMTSATKNSTFTDPLGKLMKGHKDPFYTEHTTSNVLKRPNIVSYQSIKDDNDMVLEHQERGLALLNKKGSLNGKTFDERFAKYHSAFAAGLEGVEKEFNERISETIAKNQKEHKEAVDEVRGMLEVFIAAREKALVVLKEIANKNELMDVEGIPAKLSKYEASTKQAKEKLLEIQDHN